MLQEIAPKQYHVEFAFRAPKESGRCVVFRGCFKTSFTFLFLSFEYTVIIRADYGNLVKEF